MNTERFKNIDLASVATFFTLVALIYVSRLSAHAWNFTAVGGVALFAGAYFSKKYLSVATVFVGMFITDCVLGFHEQMISVYFSYFIIIALGSLLSVESSRLKTIGYSMCGSILFFLITNFASWYGNPFYTQNLNGLMDSYILGIPFFRNQILSDVISTVVLFEAAKQVSKIYVTSFQKN